jgi:HD superfamily phosphohydrolase YqeK
LYLADFSEPRRTRPEAERARNILDAEGFVPAVKYVVRTKIDHVARKYALDASTREFRRWVELEWS